MGSVRQYLSVMDGAASGLYRQTPMQLHTQILHAVLLCKEVVIPDILFFINLELFKVVSSNAPEDVALKDLLFEAMGSGIVRPIMRLRNEGSFWVNLSKATIDGSNGIPTEAAELATQLDRMIRLKPDYAFEHWPDQGYNGGMGPQ